MSNVAIISYMFQDHQGMMPMNKAVMQLGSGKAFISKLIMSSYLRSQK